MRRLATAAGFNECVTFSFISEKAAREFAASRRPGGDRQPALGDCSRCCGRRCCPVWSIPSRTTVGTASATCGCSSWARASCAAPASRRTLSLGLVSARPTAEHWSGRARPVDLFDLIGVVEALGARAGARPCRCTAADAAVADAGPHGGDPAAATAAAPRACSAWSASVQPASPTARDIPAQDDVFVAELDLDAVADLVTMLDVGQGASAAALPVDRARPVDSGR